MKSRRSESSSSPISSGSAGLPLAVLKVDTGHVPHSDRNQPTQSPSSCEITNAGGSPLDQLRAEALRSSIVEVLRTCYDPEIPVDIYELGLIYDIDVQPDASVKINMTLTSPMCPVAGSLPPEVENKVRAVEGVASAKVEVVWDPPWSPDRMSEAAKLQLNML